MYGEGRNLRYFIGFGVLIALLIFVIVLIVHHGNTGKVAQSQRPLTSYVNDNNASVSETIVGPINAAQNHSQIDITVSNQTAAITVNSGYDGNVKTSKTYPMSTNSFSEFLNALDRLGYTKGNTASALQNDEGYCPTGQRYIYKVTDGDNTIERFWATNCGGTKTYRGNLSATINLFQAQIPDYDSLVNNTSLSDNILNLN